MTSYYNEIDAKCCAVLQRHIDDGCLPAGFVDQRGIELVAPQDVAQYDECHFFAGIGGFPLGFYRAGLRLPDGIRVWTGGFPCQDLSVAGQRAGLAGSRSGLFFEFHRLIASCLPEWVVIENVPGLLSSNGGRDFALVLGGLTGIIPSVPAQGWGNAGFARGPIYSVAYRVLDAQFHGVPQRRRRVFIVGSLGDGRCAQVLFESASRAWDPPPSRETGQGFARDVAPCLAASGRGTERTGESRGQDAVVATGFTSTGRGWWREGLPTETARQWKDGGNGLVSVRRVDSQDSGLGRDVDGMGAHLPVSGEGATPGKGRLGTGIQGVDGEVGEGDSAGTHGGVVAYKKRGGFGVSETGDIAGTLESEGGTHQGGPEKTPMIVFQPRYYTRDNKPGGQPSGTADITNCYKAGDSAPHVVAFDYCAQGSERTRIVRSGEYAQMIAGRPDAIAFDRTRGTSSGDIAGPLRKCGARTDGVNDAKADTQCVAFSNRGLAKGVFETVRADSHGALPLVATVDAACDTLYNKGITQEGEPNASAQKTNAGAVLSTLRHQVGEEAFAEWWLGSLISLQQAQILRPSMYGSGVHAETKDGRSGMDGSTSESQGDSSARAVREMWISQCLGRASQRWELEEQQARELGAYLSQLSQQGPPQAEALLDLWQASEGIRVLRQALSEIQEMGQPVDGKKQPAHASYGVRRLTPTEAERLQSFPDGHTAGQSDSARYRQLGNAVCVNVAEWLGTQLLAALEASQ